MAKSLAELKKNRSLAGLAEAVEKLSGNFQKPEEQLNFWKPTEDKAHNGSAIIRFLPAPQGEDVAFVRTYTHGFMGPSDKWFIENCPTTLGNGTPCPVCEYNSALWEGKVDGISIDDGKIFVSGTKNVKPPRPGSKRKKAFVSNVLIIKDAANPENEGKVFKFSYGQKIFDKITDAIKGDEGIDLAPIDPFDPWNGANFKLKFGLSDGQRSYAASSFDNPSPIADTDEGIEAIWSQAYSLAACVAPSTIKPYEELQRKLTFVVKGSTPRAKTVEAAIEEAPARPTEDAPKIAIKQAAIEEANTESEEDFEKYLSSLEDD